MKKKFILSFFALSLSFVGYSYALDISCSYTFDWDNYEYVGDCSPSSIIGVDGDYVGTISNFDFDLPVCDEEVWGDCSEYPDSSDLCLYLGVGDENGNIAGGGGTCGYVSDNYGNLNNSFLITIPEESISDGLFDYLVFFPEIINKSIDDSNYYYVDSFSFDLSIPGYFDDSDDPDDPDDPVVPDDPDVPVVPDDPVIPDNPGNGGLLSSFTGVVSSLNSVVIDILPYIAYLGLGIIVVVVGFIAIRWLIIWTKLKIDSNFRSKRR